MLGGDGFDGSTGVIERALRERRAVLAGDALAQPWLRDRPSVVAQGIRAAVCLPLVHDGRVLGALYADTDETGRQFTTLDAELLAEWAHQAVLLRVAQALEDRLAAVAGCVIADDGGMPAATVAAPAWNGTRP
jgi:GAF domain-containing protein